VTAAHEFVVDVGDVVRRLEGGVEAKYRVAEARVVGIALDAQRRAYAWRRIRLERVGPALLDAIEIDENDILGEFVLEVA
jgi:hypothetical protein